MNLPDGWKFEAYTEDTDLFGDTGTELNKEQQRELETFNAFLQQAIHSFIKDFQRLPMIGERFEFQDSGDPIQAVDVFYNTDDKKVMMRFNWDHLHHTEDALILREVQKDIKKMMKLEYGISS